MYQIVYGNAIGYITQTACQPVCVDVAMTAALAAQAEAVKQQVAQAQAAAAALAAQQAALAQQAAMQQAAVQQAALAQAQAEQKAPIRRAAATSSSSGTPARDRWRMQSVERQHGLVRHLWHALEVAWTGFPPPSEKGRRPVCDARLSDYSQLRRQ